VKDQKTLFPRGNKGDLVEIIRKLLNEGMLYGPGIQALVFSDVSAF
jgi:hypothetical protein